MGLRFSENKEFGSLKANLVVFGAGFAG